MTEVQGADAHHRVRAGAECYQGDDEVSRVA